MNLRADDGRVAGRSGFLSADSDGKVDIFARNGVALEERDGELQSDIISTTNKQNILNQSVHVNPCRLKNIVGTSLVQSTIIF